MIETYNLKRFIEAQNYNSTYERALQEICEALYCLKTDDIMSVMWEIDCYKVRSYVTLFHYVAPQYEVFQKLLDKYFCSAPCHKTLDILEQEKEI